MSAPASEPAPSSASPLAPHATSNLTSTPAHDAAARDAVNPQKLRTGLSRVWHAGGYSVAGLRAGWGETAFRQEALAALVLVPAAFWLGRSWVEVALLAGSVWLVLIVELLNSGLESAIDRVSFEMHELSRRAKDIGSAAVFMSLLLCAAIWAGALWHRFA